MPFTPHRRKRSLCTAFDNKENDEPTPPKKQRLFERRPHLKMDSNLELQQSIKRQSEFGTFEMVQKRHLKKSGEMSQQQDENTMWSFPSSQSIVAAAGAGRSNTKLGSANSLTSANSMCSFNTADSFPACTVMEDDEDNSDMDATEDGNVPQRRLSGGNSSMDPVHLRIDPPDQESISFPCSNQPDSATSARPTVQLNSSSSQQLTSYTQDEECISPGVLCSPTTYPLKYETVRDFGIPDSVNFISPQTMSKIMRESPKNLIVIDCRFPHEYNGGHIKGALNLYRPQDVQEFLFQPMRAKDSVIVFHCEFSQKRGPKMYRFVRQLDRERHQWPVINYVDMYVLKGGFKAYHESGAEARQHCEPQGYVPMSHDDHGEELRASYASLRAAWDDIKKGSSSSSKRSCVSRCRQRHSFRKSSSVSLFF